MLRRCRSSLLRLPADVLKKVRVRLAEEAFPLNTLKDSVLKFLEPYENVRTIRGLVKDCADALVKYAKADNDASLNTRSDELSDIGKELAAKAYSYVAGEQTPFRGLVERYANGELTAEEKSKVEADPDVKEFLDACIADKDKLELSTLRALTGMNCIGFFKTGNRHIGPAIRYATARIDQLKKADPKTVPFLGRDATRLSKTGAPEASTPAPGGVSNRTTLLATGNAPENISPLLDVQPDTGAKNKAHGTFNEVVMADVKGKTYVFKPEFSGSAGLNASGVGMAAGHGLDQSMVGLNIATRKMAEMVGCGNVVVDSKASVYNNQLALQMEKAEGLTAGSYFVDVPKDVSKKPSFTACGALLQRLDVSPADRSAKDLKQAGSLFRQATDLQWVDRLTGQLDRNENNYLVDFPEGGDSVSLKGIDNDFSFPAGQKSMKEFIAPDFLDFYRKLGSETELMSKYEVFQPPRHDHPPQIAQWLKQFASKVPDAGFEVRERPGVRGPDQYEVVLDAEKCKSQEVLAAFSKQGHRSVSLPPVMSASMAEQLLKLGEMHDEDLEKAVRQNLKGLVVGERNVDATVSRLKEMIGIAREYKNANPPRVIPDDQWTAESTAKLLMGDLKSSPWNEDEDPDAQRAKLLVANYAAREFHDLLKVFVPKGEETSETGASVAV